jgi:hypothetical protein
VSYLSRLPYVQAVGMVGVCTSGGNAAYLGAVEPRVKALATVAAYSEVDQPAVNHGSVGSYDYYLNEARGNVPEYRNESALMGLAGFLEFDPVGTASAVTTPTMVVHSDGCAFPAAAKSSIRSFGTRRNSCGLTGHTTTTTTLSPRSITPSRT